MKYLLTGVAALVLLTACGQKHKAALDPTPPGINFFQENLPVITVQKGDPATAEAALGALSLAKSRTGRVQFSSKKVNGDSAIFNDVRIALPKSSGDGEYESEGLDLKLDPKENGLFLIEGEELRAERLEFQGLAQRNGKPSFGRMVLSGVSFTSKSESKREEYSEETGEMSERDIKTEAQGKIASIDLVNPSPEVAAWVAGLFGKGEPQLMPEGAALAFDRWAVDDLRLTSVETDSDSVFLVKGIEVLGLKNERAARVAIDKLSLDATDKSGKQTIDIALGAFELRGSDLASLGKQPAASGAAESAIMDVFALSGNNPIDPGFEQLTIGDFRFKAEGTELTLLRLVSKVGRDKAGTAVKFVTEPWTMTLAASDAGASSELSGQMAALGFDKVELTGAGDQVYDPKTDLLTLVKGKNYFEVKKGFRLDIYAAYEGTSAMNRDEQSLDPGEMGDMLTQTRLHGAEVSLKDYGLVDRSINLIATQQNEDPVEFRKGIKKTLAMAALPATMSGMDPMLVAEFSDAVGSFVQKPKTLTFRFDPAKPVALSTLVDEDGPKGLTRKGLGFSADNK